MNQVTAYRAPPPLLMVLLLAFCGTGGLGAAEEVRPADFVPAETLVVLRAPDAAALFGKGVERIEQVQGRAGALKQQILTGVQALFPDQNVGTFADAARAFGLAPEQPLIVGFVPAINGESVDTKPEGTFFAVLPLGNRMMLEKLILQQLLPQMYKRTYRCCRRMRGRIRYNWRFTRAAREAREVKRKLDLPDLINQPGLKAYRCPGGGTYFIPAGENADQAPDNIECDAHGQNPDMEAFANNLAQGLPEIEIGNFRLIGSATLGAAYGLGEGYCVIGNDARVIKAALEAAAGKRPRLNPRFPANGQLQAVFHWSALADLLDTTYDFSYKAKRGRTPALNQFMGLLRSQPALALALRAENGKLILSGSMKLGNSSWAMRLREVEPGLSALINLMPGDAPLVIAGNILPELAEVFTLALAGFEGGDASYAEFIQLFLPREVAWAMTSAANGGFGGFTRVPHMVFLVRRDDEKISRALDLLPGAIAGGNWLRILPPRKTDGGLSYQVIAKPPRRGNDNAEPRPLFFHTSQSPSEGLPGFFALTTLAEDISALLDRKNRARENPPGGGFAANQDFFALGGPPGKANLIAFIDVPRLMVEVARARLRARPFRRNEAMAFGALGQIRLEAWIEAGVLKLKAVQRLRPPPTAAPQGEEPAKEKEDPDDAF